MVDMGCKTRMFSFAQNTCTCMHTRYATEAVSVYMYTLQLCLELFKQKNNWQETMCFESKFQTTKSSYTAHRHCIVSDYLDEYTSI